MEGDVANALRFLGWFRDHRSREADCRPPPPLSLKGVWSDDRLGQWVEEYLLFLDERSLKWSSRANYCTGLINILEYAIVSDGFVLTEERGLTTMEQLLNLRRQVRTRATTPFHIRLPTTALRGAPLLQCDGNATIEKMYRRKHGQWLDWEDVQRTRLTVLERLAETAASPTKRHKLLEDALMISLVRGCRCGASATRPRVRISNPTLTSLF